MTRIIGDDDRFLGHFVDQRPSVYAGFSSLSAMMSYVESIPKHARRAGAWNNDNEKFYGSRSVSHAMQIARDGWQEGVQNARKVADSISISQAQGKRRIRAVAGGNVNVGRLLSGNPKHMTQRRKLDGRRVMTLFVGIGSAALVPAQAFIARAAAVAAICDIAETQGYSCEIVMISNQARDLPPARNRSALQTVVTVKSAGERFNLDDLVFALGHPSYFRRFTFAICAAQDDLREIHGNMGYGNDMFTKTHVPGPSEIHIPFLSIPQWRAMEETEDMLKIAQEMLRKINVFGLPIDIS